MLTLSAQCRIAPLHLPAGDLFRIFSQAQYVAQLLGLGCPGLPLGEENCLTDVQWQERTNALCCMQDIAASVHWVTGMETSGLSKLSPSDKRLDTSNGSTDATLDQNARNGLTKIDVVIFERLLTPSQPLMNTGHDCTCSITLVEELNRWYETSHISLYKQRSPGECVNHIPAQDMTAKYHFLRSVLLHARLGSLEDARVACDASDEFLKTLVVAWRSDPSLGVHLGLAL
jgi:hypothetical protein